MVFKRGSITEDDYLESAIRGEPAGQEYLVNTYRDMAYTIAIRIVLNSEDAEEVVQDSFLKAFKHLGHFRKAARFSTWLYRIVYNTALTKARTSTLLTRELETGDLHDFNKAEQSLLQADQQKYVELALMQLKEEDRIIITLHYIAEKNIKEIGEILDMKRSAIKMRLLRGRKQLESHLQKLLNNEITGL